MSVTAIWSPLHGASSTANALAIAVCMAEGHDCDTLVMQTHFAMNNLERPLIGTSSMSDDDLFGEIGIDQAAHLYTANQFDKVKTCTITISEQLSVLPGTTKPNRETFDNEEERLIQRKVIRELSRYYSEVVIDVNAGYGEQSMTVLSAADNVVVCLRQNKKMIEDLLTNKEFQTIASKKKVYFLFGEYDDMSKLSLRNVRKKYKELSKANSGAIPYCTAYKDAISDCSVFGYLLRVIDLYDPEEEDDDNWWSEVDEFTRKLM